MMKHRGMVGAFFLFMGLGFANSQAYAAETTFGAGATTNPQTGVQSDIREVINVTLSDPNSSWVYTDWHADNFTVKYNYFVSREAGAQDQNLFEFGNSIINGGGGATGLPNGTYNCWAFAHGYTDSNGQTTNWDAGVTSKYVSLNNI